MEQSKLSMSTQLENDPSLASQATDFQNELPQHYRFILKKFRKISRSFVNFNLLFTFCLVAELAFFLPFLSRPTLLAFFLGALFLTCFSYLVLLFYFQAKKPEQLLQLKEQFLQSCRQLLAAPHGSPPHPPSPAQSLLKLSQYLQGFEWNFYKIPPFFQFLSRPLSRFSAFCYWEDVFQLKYLLLNASIGEHLKQIRATPTDP